MDTLRTPTLVRDYSNITTNYPTALLWAVLCFSVLFVLHPTNAQAETVAGFIQGDVAVGPDGSANYSIPIGVPSGIAGMQPELSINYNSNSGNGLLGYGFSLSGLSVISRCPATKIQDGFKGVVRFDENDRFCMDGQRLIAIAGSDGAAGTEYRTEIDSFSKIISYGQKGSGPLYWQVTTKSGQTFEYGNSEDSRSERAGYKDVRVWAASSISDAVGNTLTFSYYKNDTNGEHYPTSIDYAGNSIKLVYEDRPDPTVGFQAGGKLSTTKRLKRITLYGAGTKVQEYFLNYLHGEKSFLETITHADANGNAMPPLTFDWANGVVDQPQQFASSYKNWLPHGSGQNTRDYVTGSNGDGVYSALIDMNGDGLLDQVTHKNYATGVKGIHVALNNGHGFGGYTLWFPHISTTIDGEVYANLARIVQDDKNDFIKGRDGSSYISDIIDMNGDGLPDRVVNHNHATGVKGVHVALNNGHGFGALKLWLPNGSGQETNNYIQAQNSYGIYSDLRDVNGDGLPDQVSGKNYATETSGIHVALNNGHGFEPYTLWSEGFASMVIYLQVSNSDGISADLRDMNGDGLPDKVIGNGIIGINVALNTGSGFSPGTTWLRPGTGLHVSSFIQGRNSNGIFSDLRDMNGDGLPDQVSNKNYATGALGMHVALNNGYGFEPYTLWEPDLSFIQYEEYVQRIDGGNVYSDLLDVNGDGLPDRVRTMFFAAGIAVSLNNGHGFDTAVKWITSGGSITDDLVRANNGDGTYQDLLDINGDGLPDRVAYKNLYNNNPGVHVVLNNFAKPVLVGIINQPGNKIAFTYKHLSDSSVYTKGTGASYPEMDVAGAMQVVSKVTNPDGLGGTQSSSYRYGGLKVDIQGRGNLGFAWMESTDNQTGIVTRTEYSQTFPNKGQVIHTEQRLPKTMGGLLGTVNPLGETTVAVNFLITHQGSGVVVGPKGHRYGNVYFPYVEQTTESSYDLEGTWLSTVTTNNVYDTFGNATNVTIVTQDSEDTVTQATTSYYPDDAARALGRMSRATVTHTNGQGQLFRTSDFEYYPNGLLWREIVEPDNQELRLQTEYEYDNFGNKTRVTTSGLNIETRSTSTIYSTDGRFPVTVTNALGHSETRTYDPVLGVMTQLIGPNGLPTTWQYDGFGRKIREDRADGTWTTITRSMCDGFYCPEDAPLGTYLYTVTQSSGSTPVAEYSDQLGRVIRKVTTGFDGTLVYQDTEYNHLGQVGRASQPYFKGEASRWSSSEYDLLGRVKKVTTQGPNGLIHNTFDYSGYTTTATDAMGHVKVTKKNAQGKVLRVDEEEGGWVTYTYDAIGNLLETNANGVITTLKYDDRNRKYFMDDPDMGQWNYKYDVLGNLTSQTDANGQTISMVYDKLGRMVQRTEPEGVTVWEYDDNIIIGKLTRVAAPDGYVQNIMYDGLGRVSSTTVTAGGQTLTTGTTYDNFGRVSRTTRPEGFVVDNVYNAQGYLEAVRTPAALIGDYDELQLTQVWSEIEQPLIAELEQAQQQADELSAQAAVYRERAQYYWDTAQLIREQAPNKQFLEDDRLSTITELQQTSTNLNQLATKLEQKAAEYQLLANSILSLMPTDWQTTWFINAKARYDQYARNAITKIQRAYWVNENSLVWTPIDVAGITIFMQVKPNFHGADAITAQEKQHLEDIGNWEASTASLLRTLAESVRAQQAARAKYQTALANHPAMVWVPIEVDGITTMMYVPSGALTPEQVLTAEELQLYNAPDLLQTDGIALAEFYTNRALEQVALQREVEDQREYYARTASRLSQTIAAYSDAIAQLQGTTAQVTFWHATGRDAAGRLTSSVVGNGLETRNFYDQATGQLTYITSGFGSSTPVRELSYEYDALNNVTSRIDRVQGVTESFQYDRLDRLTNSYVQGQFGGVDYNNSIDYSYDAMGNIWNKSDIGDYSYGDLTRSVGNAGPHALVSAGPNHTGYQYDDNGNMLLGGGRDITWSSFNKPIDFSKDGVWQASFKYGPDRARYLKVTPSSTTFYLGKGYERVETGTKVEHKYFIYADGDVVAIHVKTTNNAIAQLDQTRYLHRDSLGSIDTITDGQGQIVDRMSYDPFGARRGGDWRVGTTALYIPTLTNRGFTGHEHVDEMGLIHMNGRIYDPQLGRFLSADPTMQFPHQSQGYNRYSYVQNNPLKYTDPSGYGLFSDIIDAIGDMVKSLLSNPIIRTAVAIYLASVTGVWAQGFAQGVWGAVLGGAAAGFVSGGIMSGSLEGAFKGAIYGAISAGIANEIGHGWGANWGDGVRTLAHGVTQGAITAARGGQFKSGFIGAFVGHAVGGPIQTALEKAGVAARTVAAAMVGGVSSVLGGGKFANGALSAAFTHMFNREAHEISRKRYLLGVHTNTDSEQGFTDGHAWISVEEVGSGEKHTYGLWKDGGGMSGVSGTSGEGVYMDMELTRDYGEWSSKYYVIDQVQYDELQSYITTPDTWYPTHTCADWARDAIQVTTGVSLDADDYFGFETPRELSGAIGY